ncbi:hypothetical protein Dsin_015535 [Dipteronia sinensis]|uniref:Uncharacterized protein n=1 Tax=Dipteronia sinensis TaxID=43782 RepID=A0AAE0E4S4_9ROSI|nr:hypothetical protein Dsin_015535 [Dipteronia sinensis]
MSQSHSMCFASSPPPSPTQSPDYSHYFKSTGELFQKYPLPEAPSRSKPRSKTSSSRKDKSPASTSAHYKPALYSSPQSTPSTAAYLDSVSVSSIMSHSSTGSPFHLSSSSDLLDPTQAFMASRAELSARTYDSPREGSTGPTPIIKEPPDATSDQSAQIPKPRPINGSWFQLDDSSPDTYSEMSAWLDLQMAKSEQTLKAILREFVSRFTGSLQDCSAYSSYQAVSTESPSGPQVPIQILLEKFSKPIDAIAYFDTGSHNTMMNPNILAPDTWKSHTRYFKAADGKAFTTNLISKTKIGIKIFPSYTIWTQVLGTSLPDKAILIGWDVYCQCQSLRILPSGIRYKMSTLSSVTIRCLLLLFVMTSSPLSSSWLSPSLVDHQICEAFLERHLEDEKDRRIQELTIRELEDEQQLEDSDGGYV